MPTSILHVKSLVGGKAGDLRGLVKPTVASRFVGASASLSQQLKNGPWAFWDFVVVSGEQRYQAGLAVERLCVVAISSSALLSRRGSPLVGVMARETRISRGDLIRPAQVAFGVFDPTLLEILLEPKGDGDEKPQDVRRHLRHRWANLLYVSSYMNGISRRKQVVIEFSSKWQYQNDSGLALSRNFALLGRRSRAWSTPHVDWRGRGRAGTSLGSVCRLCRHGIKRPSLGRRQRGRLGISGVKIH